jgi:hypothetical protein
LRSFMKTMPLRLLINQPGLWCTRPPEFIRHAGECVGVSFPATPIQQRSGASWNCASTRSRYLRVACCRKNGISVGETRGSISRSNGIQIVCSTGPRSR